MLRLARFLYHNYLITLIAVLCLCIGIAIAGTAAFGNRLVETQALQSSQAYVKTLKTSWDLYHQAIVQPLQDVDGVTISPQYQTLEGGIPAPATYILQLSKRLQNVPGNPQFFLHSEYPFPNRQGDEEPDQFQQDALAYFQANPSASFYRQQMIDGFMTFNYAEPLIMEASCVACHNSSPESPKQDWQTGAIAGVIAVRQPLNSMVQQVNREARFLGLGIGLLTTIGLVGGGLVRIYGIHLQQRLQDELQQKTIALERLDLTDPLTQVANRQQFSEALNKEWRRVWRRNGNLSLLVCDVDYFKLYNDAYGFPAGDRCLQAIAQTMQRQLKRAGDLVARMGEDEFYIILPETTASEAEEVAAIILDAIHHLKLAHAKSSVSPYVSVSIGIASTVPTRDHQPNELIRLAEQALHEDAKLQGGNDFAVREM